MTPNTAYSVVVALVSYSLGFCAGISFAALVIWR